MAASYGVTNWDEFCDLCSRVRDRCLNQNPNPIAVRNRLSKYGGNSLTRIVDGCEQYLTSNWKKWLIVLTCTVVLIVVALITLAIILAFK